MGVTVTLYGSFESDEMLKQQSCLNVVLLLCPFFEVVLLVQQSFWNVIVMLRYSIDLNAALEQQLYGDVKKSLLSYKLLPMS